MPLVVIRGTRISNLSMYLSYGILLCPTLLDNEIVRLSKMKKKKQKKKKKKKQKRKKKTIDNNDNNMKMITFPGEKHWEYFYNSFSDKNMKIHFFCD